MASHAHRGARSMNKFGVRAATSRGGDLSAHRGLTEQPCVPVPDLPAGEGLKVPSARTSPESSSPSFSRAQGRLEFETLLADLCARFVRACDGELDGEINRALGRILTFFDVDQAIIFGILPEARQAHIQYLQYNPTIIPAPITIEYAAVFPYSYDWVVRQEKTLVVESVDDYHQDAPIDRQTFIQLGLKSLLSIPIQSSDGVSYVMAFTCNRGERRWPESYIPRLQLLGEILVGAVLRTRTDEALRESEERLSLAAHSAEAGLWSLDLQSGDVWSTGKTLELMGLNPGGLDSFEEILQVVHPEDRAELQQAIRRAIDTGENYRHEYRVVFPDGSTRWIAGRGRVHHGPTGAPDRLMGVMVDITERKMTEERFRESEVFNRTILASLHDQIAILDRKGRILEVNKAWVVFARANGVAGSEAEEWIGVDYIEVCRDAAAAGDASAGQALDGLMAVLDNRKAPFELEYPCDSPSESRWFLLTALPLERPEGGAIVAHSDISDRKRAEAEAAASQKRLQYALEASTDGVWDWNIKTGEVHFSLPWIRSLGYSPQEVTSHVSFWEGIVHPDDMPQVRKALSDHFEGRTPLYEIENRLRKKTGEYRWNLDRGKVVEWDLDGQPLRMVGTDSDITERKRNEEQLRRSEEEFRSMFELSAVGKAWVDPATGRFARVNQKLCDITGYSEDELLGLTFSDITHLNDRERDGTLYARVLQGETDIWYSEKRYVRKDGRPVWVSVTGSLLRDSEGNPVRSVANIVDIDQEKRAAEDVRRLQAELAHVSRVTTVGVLAASIAHELNQPLAAILSNSQAARRFLESESVDRDEIASALEDIIDDDRRATEVIRRLRSLLQRGELEQIPVGINEAIGEVLALLHGEVLENNIRVELRLDEGLPRGSGDRIQVQQVILNLVLNAVEAMRPLPAGRPRDLVVES